MGLLSYLKIPFYYYCWEGVCHGISGNFPNANISGRRELSVIHQNLKQNESTGALIGCKEVELGVDVR